MFRLVRFWLGGEYYTAQEMLVVEMLGVKFDNFLAEFRNL